MSALAFSCSDLQELTHLIPDLSNEGKVLLIFKLPSAQNTTLDMHLLTKLGELKFSRKPFLLYFTFGKSFLNIFLFPGLEHMKQEVFPEDLFPTISCSKHSQLTFYDTFLKLNSF